MLEFLFVFAIMFAMVAMLIGFLYIPILIANARGICGGERATIIILSWLGIFFGITWFVALILSLIWQGKCAEPLNNLDYLEKVAKLYKEKVITKAQYEAFKEKLLG